LAGRKARWVRRRDRRRERSGGRLGVGGRGRGGGRVEVGEETREGRQGV